METNDKIKAEKNFNAIFHLYTANFFCVGVLAANINNIVEYLPATASDIAMLAAIQLIVGIFSILFFGYYSDKISEKFSRKKVFLFSNFTIFLGFFMVALSVNYTMFLIFHILAAFGTGAFLPIGFAIIGDTFPPNERGKKYGLTQFGLLVGTGGGIIFGGLLGKLGGPIGWRLAYGLGTLLVLSSIFRYYLNGFDPERGRADPELIDFEGEIEYDYKITFKNLRQIFKKKSVAAILLSVAITNIAATTLGLWAIFYLSTKIPGDNADILAASIIILTGLGALPGTILGGKIGDKLSESGNMKGRALISLIGTVSGASIFIIFYLFLPFYADTPVQFLASFLIFVIIGSIGFFLSALSLGNIFAIYSECCVPENRGIANALNGLMAKTGGIIGNLLIYYLIIRDLSLLSFAIALVLFISLAGTFLLIIPYFYYPKEAINLRDTMSLRREELEKKLNKK